MHIHEIVNMGGYGQYVWSAYAITLSVFGLLAWIALRERKHANQTVKQFLQRQQHES